MHNPDHISESLENFFLFIYLNSLLRIRDVKKFGSGMEKNRIRDPGRKKFGSGMEKNSDPGSVINIPDPQHWFSIIKVGAGTGSAPCRFL